MARRNRPAWTACNRIASAPECMPRTEAWCRGGQSGPFRETHQAGAAPGRLEEHTTAEFPPTPGWEAASARVQWLVPRPQETGRRSPRPARRTRPASPMFCAPTSSALPRRQRQFPLFRHNRHFRRIVSNRDFRRVDSTAQSSRLLLLPAVFAEEPVARGPLATSARLLHDMYSESVAGITGADDKFQSQSVPVMY